MLMWFRKWRRRRLLQRLVDLSTDVMLTLASGRVERELTPVEREELPRLFAKWICADDARALELLDRPVRTIHLFLSEMA